MADEKDPHHHLESSKNPDDEATTQEQRVQNTATPGSAPQQDVDPDAQQTPETGDEPDTADVDPETRMLQQIAALDKDAGETGEHPERTPDDSQETTVLDDTATPIGAITPVDQDHDDQQSQEQTPPRSSDDTAIQLEPVAAAPPAAGGGSSGGDDTAMKGGRTKKRRWPWVLVIVVLLLGGGYVAAAYATQDTLPSTLTVEGVDVSGLSVDEAAPILEDEFAARAQREITIAVDDEQATIVPADAGYSYDVDDTLDELTDLTFKPVDLWARLFGEAHASAVTHVDEDAASEAVAGLAEQLSFEPTEGSVVFEQASLDYTAPTDGFTVNQDDLAEQLDAEWLSEETDIAAPGDVIDPAVSAEEWDEFVANTAQPLIDDAYTVTANETTADLTPEQLGAAAEVRVEEATDDDDAETTDQDTTEDTANTEDTDGDHPVLILDDEALTASLADNNSDFASTNKDATVRLAGSAGSAKPEVVPGSTGRGVDGEQLVEEILADLAGEQTRDVTVDVHEVEPNVTTEEAEAWDVTHAVAEYATPYPASDAPRTANLKIGAERVNGTVVMPGEEFNLNSILAPITAANGYHSSGVVESGVTTNALGGGLSQIATMSYNAGFLGGMEILEHKPHSRWFDRYPQGRESTYWEGQINVRWKNDTDAPVIVEMWLADSEVHTRLWGSDYYDVSTTTSDPYNFTASPTIRSDDAECISESGGDQGFTVDVNRTKTPPDGSAIQESWSWAYSGWPTVICE